MSHCQSKILLKRKKLHKNFNGLDFKASDIKKYKMQTIQNSIVDIQESEKNNLLLLYYLAF